MANVTPRDSFGLLGPPAAYAALRDDEEAGIRVELLDGWVDLERREVHRGDRVESLTGREAGLLEALADAAGRDMARGTLLQQVWGLLPDTATRTLDATVRRLRRKVEPVPGSPQLLLTVHGVGYRWAPVPCPTAPPPTAWSGWSRRSPRCPTTSCR